jgi:hypothetical protein
MLLNGSCHCAAVKFSLESHTPYPYMHCYCSICRKTAGGGGYAINIMGEAESMKIKGEKYLSVYRVKMGGKRSPARRHFCSKCGSALWVWDPRWPESIYPFASAIDTPLPRPPETQHIMLDYAAPWLEVPKNKRNLNFGAYPKEAILDWHRRRKLLA